METDKKSVIRVGSRKSELALIQTNFVIDSLKKLYPEKEFSIVSMTTLGDRILDISLPKIGEKSLFTKDLEEALSNNSVDFVVHSLKDLPTSLPEGLAIGAVFEREDPRDALVLSEKYKGHTLSTLPDGCVIGTSSLRRTAQLRASHPQLSVADVRGNLNTRLRKLDAQGGPFAALLLAHSGLQRMGWAERASKVLSCAEMMYAVGQGALAVECRADNTQILSLLAPLNHAGTYCRVLAERSFLATLGGGCSAPVGISTSLKPLGAEHKLSLSGAVWSLDGKTKVHDKIEQTYPQIHKSNKHRLSPDEDGDCKKFKTDADDDDKATDGKVNPIEELNEKISAGDAKNCEDLPSEGKKVMLFCGMTENTNVPIEVIAKADELGRTLAKNLISKGALEVMKVTQDYIRSAVGEKSS